MGERAEERYGRKKRDIEGRREKKAGQEEEKDIMFGKIGGREVRKIGGIEGRRKRGMEDWKKAGQGEDK
jgi:hypothetical protein